MPGRGTRRDMMTLIMVTALMWLMMHLHLPWMCCRARRRVRPPTGTAWEPLIATGSVMSATASARHAPPALPWEGGGAWATPTEPFGGGGASCGAPSLHFRPIASEDFAWRHKSIHKQVFAGTMSGRAVTMRVTAGAVEDTVVTQGEREASGCIHTVRMLTVAPTCVATPFDLF